MTNTGKTLIISLVLADLVICAYLLYPRDEKKSAAPTDAALIAPERADSSSGESHVIAGNIVRPASPGVPASASVNANARTTASGSDVRPLPPAAAVVAPAPVTPVAPVAPATPAANLANAPATELQPQPQGPQLQVQQPAPQQVRQAQQSPQPQQLQAQQAQQAQRYSVKPVTTQHVEESRGHEELRRHGSNEVGALMTELLVRESAKLDPSLPPPPPTDRDEVSHRSSNPVAAAMTDQLVKESAKVAPASAAPKQPGTQ
ncbi:hypothetical protein [Paraburkholderia rhynchosiae]|uniref:Extensin n=1 Tax=Paraburkholderia rhynchosiae TaxID=487049 RepID=A0A2N7WNC2_9BURK|nr:hypothetical protein [Paraburkholderia rhynchosiae]PMS30947.1 hypothetical protein C0Z16_11965 [Paraburkholderia rhynchosiae]CAB3732823.1 hypothetical protein LMG27174_05966 [Paraburkholderia rhynchosiae]